MSRREFYEKNPLPRRLAGDSGIYDILNSLSPVGKEVFLILRSVSADEGSDLIYVHWRYAAGYCAHEPLGEEEFKRGLSSLLNHRLIARSPYPYLWWIDYSALRVDPLYAVLGDDDSYAGFAADAEDALRRMPWLFKKAPTTREAYDFSLT